MNSVGSGNVFIFLDTCSNLFLGMSIRARIRLLQQLLSIAVSVFNLKNLPEVSAAERYFFDLGENRERERVMSFEKSEEMVKCKITVSEQKTRGGEETTAKSAF